MTAIRSGSGHRDEFAGAGTSFADYAAACCDPDFEREWVGGSP
jgi:hypothetical protein